MWLGASGAASWCINCLVCKTVFVASQKQSEMSTCKERVPWSRVGVDVTSDGTGRLEGVYLLDASWAWYDTAMCDYELTD